MFDTMNEASIFNDVNIRMAIEHAIDKDAIVDAMGYGFMYANNQMTPPQMASFNADLPTREYNVQKAKDLLAAAGHPNGFNTTIITMGGAEKNALAIQEFLRAINIEANIELVDNPKFWDYMREGWSNAMVITDYAVQASFPAWLRAMFPPTSTIDVSVKLPDEVIAKIEPALTEPDTVKAKQLSDELIRLIWEDCSYVPINSNAMGYILAPYVKDSRIFTYFDWTIWDPENTWLDK
jgi:peptide/nickel transport system substrate-binding protein